MTLTSEKIQTLQAFLNNARGVDTLIVLDLQDNAAVAAAAAAIKATGMQNRVALKFFAESAVPDQELNGRDISNLVSAQINNWGSDLWSIIQFNDGQLTLQSRTGDATIFKYGYFIDPLVWANYFRATGRLIGIGISQPTDVSKQEKLIALRRLSQYYESSDNAMPTIGFLINPDSSWVDSTGCKFYRFNANNDANGNVVTSAFSFDGAGEQRRRNFAKARDYIIADVLPQADGSSRRGYQKHTAEEADFRSTFCNTALDSNIIAKPY